MNYYLLLTILLLTVLIIYYYYYYYNYYYYYLLLLLLLSIIRTTSFSCRRRICRVPVAAAPIVWVCATTASDAADSLLESKCAFSSVHFVFTCLLFVVFFSCLLSDSFFFLFYVSTFFPARRGFLDLIHSRKMPHSSWHTRSESCPLATIPQHATCHAAATAATSTTSTMLIVTGKKYENALFVIDHSLLTNITYY